MRKTTFTDGEYYHIYNRGTDKRDIFLCQEDMDRFFLGMQLFNSTAPVGSIFEFHFKSATVRDAGVSADPLVEFLTYDLNPNHFHLVLKQVTSNGISKFMHRLGTGYTNFFNEKYERTGGLFQGTYKAKHITTNEYLLLISVYTNLNFKVHGLEDSPGSLWKSSWYEYIGEDDSNFCKKDIILEQFSTKDHYRMYSEKALKDILRRRMSEKQLSETLLEA